MELTRRRLSAHRLTLGLRALAFLAIATTLITGCHPEFDWRELDVKDGGFRILMPAKPARESRSLQGFPGNPVMHLWSARVGVIIFGAGYADFIAVDEQILAALGKGLAGNIQGKIVSEREVTASAATGNEFVAEGKIAGESAWLRARVISKGRRVFQLVVLGRGERIAADDLEMYFDSFRLVAP